MVIADAQDHPGFNGLAVNGNGLFCIGQGFGWQVFPYQRRGQFGQGRYPVRRQIKGLAKIRFRGPEIPRIEAFQALEEVCFGEFLLVHIDKNNGLGRDFKIDLRQARSNAYQPGGITGSGWLIPDHRLMTDTYLQKNHQSFHSGGFRRNMHDAQIDGGESGIRTPDLRIMIPSL